MHLNRYRRVLTLLFITLSFFMYAGAASAESGRVTKATIENGLTVLIEEQRSAPAVSIQMWVRVGGADEPDRLAGISHVFEHMLFKGTAKRKVGELAGAIESVGGDINAYTSFDNTVYHLTVPSRYFATGLDVISDAIQNSAFDPEELKKELEVVLEEIRMNEDSPGRNLYKMLLSTAYTSHPYKRPVIGSVETVKGLTRDEIVRFFRRWYIPGNMTLVIAGDVDARDALDAVKKEFNKFKNASDPHRKRPVELRQAGIRAQVASKELKETHIGMAFHIPAIRDEDTFTIDVMSLILGGGESSRLYKRLKADSSLVHSISTYPMSLKDPGLFFITATLDEGKADPAIDAVLEEIRRLAAYGPEASEVAKAKLNLESEFVYSRETVDGLAGKLGYYASNIGDIGHEKKYIEGIRKVTAEDVSAVANRYLSSANMTVAALVPLAAKETMTAQRLTETVKNAEARAASAFKAAAEPAGETTKVRLENGITLIVKEIHTNPTVAMYAAFPGGVRFEEARTNGLGNFTASMLTAGTRRWSREELAVEVDGMAGGITGFSGWNSTGVSGKFLSSYFDRGLSVFADVIMNPTFPQDEIEKTRADIVAAIRRQEDNPSSYAFKLLYKDLFRKHPYGMPVSGSLDSIKGITRDDIVSHYERHFTPERMVLVIVGDVKTADAVEKVRGLLKGFKPGAAALVAPPSEERAAGVRSTGAVKDKAQTNIGLGFLGASIGSRDSYALRVLAEVLSGQGGRLFINLRDKKSLAYSISAFSKEGVDPGMFGVYIGTAPEKKDAAIQGILAELTDVRENKVQPDEILRAKRSLIGGYELGLQEVSSQASDMANNELYGLGFDFSKRFAERIEAVTGDDILNAAREYLRLDAYTISIVGPNGAPPANGAR